MNTAKTLKAKHVIELFPSAPFNFDATLHKPDHFPSPDNAWVPGIRWQTMRWRRQPLGLKFENQGTIAQPCLSLSIWSARTLSPGFLSQLVDEITCRYNLQLDLPAFYRRFRGDSRLRRLLTRWRGMRPMSPSSLYEYLIVAIVLQNATVRRSVSMMRALFEAYGSLLSYDDRQLYCFWEPASLEQVDEQALRELKVGYRARSIKRVTDAFARKELDEHELRSKPKAEQREALLRLYGIGPASVGYILFEVFHHWDELNHISPWEQKIYSKLFFDTDPAQPVSEDDLLHFFEIHFGGYRMLAVHYVWEDLFWKRQHEHIAWLEPLIRL